jgi:hypothetical protein
VIFLKKLVMFLKNVAHAMTVETFTMQTVGAEKEERGSLFASLFLSNFCFL